jgi:toxin ParE1/3/4
MPSIFKRPRAEEDIAEIWDFIAEDNESRADGFIDELNEKFALLAVRPLIGRERKELADNLRSFPIGRYIIFYTILREGIEVIRVLHGARDIETIFHR